MHVREIPGIIFRERVIEPRRVNLRAYMQARDPEEPWRSICREYEDEEVLYGETTEGYWLRLRELDPPTPVVLGVADSELGAVLGDWGQTIRAGRWSHEVWSYGKGSKSSETVWAEVRERKCVSGEGLEQGAILLEYVGSLMRRGAEMLAKGPFEESTHWESQIQPTQGGRVPGNTTRGELPQDPNHERFNLPN